MAEFSLGLTKTAVEGTLSLVKSAVEEEKRLRDTVQNDLVFITDEFDVMRSFLQVANREHAANDEVALALLRQLRTLAFDVEDCVENVVHLDKPSRWEWLRRAWHTVYCPAPPLPLDDAVAEMKQLKARVEDLRQRNLHYNNLIRNSSNITQQGPPPAEESADSTRPSSVLFQILRDAWVASGKWCHSMCNLQELIAREGDDDLQLQVISVGSGGDLGTASIISNAYYDPKICEKFKSRAWVKLTHPFNHDEFIKSMLTQLCATSHQANTSVDFWTRIKAKVMEDNPMKAKLMQQMRGQRYLVVLQDVFTSQDWDVIRMCLPDCNNGSRIVVLTPQLGIALLCTGKPYQVSELQHFSDGRFICAFFRKKMQSTIMDDFKCQLRRGGGVISVWGAGDIRRRERLVDIMYKGIINRLKEFDGIQFERHTWVDVPNPFDLKVFAQRLFLNFYSDDIRSGEITEVGKKGEAGLIERCRWFLFEEDCLVVINGVRSTDDWGKIESNFLVVPSSSEPSTSTRTTKRCILVVTDEKAVARHCVKDAAAVFRVEHLEADTAIVNLMKKGTWYCELGCKFGEVKKGRLFYDRSNDAEEWWSRLTGLFSFEKNTRDLLQGKSGLVMVSGNIAYVRLKAFLRSAYHDYHQDGSSQKSRHRSWVDVPKRQKGRFGFDRLDVPNPHYLMDFSWRLLLDFYSDDPKDKEKVAVDLMEGTITDPIEECRKLLREDAGYLVVIHGQGFSKEHWDLIRDKLLSGPIQGKIIVDAIDDFWGSRRYDWLAKECSNPTNRIEAKDVGYFDGITKEYYRLFSNNYESERMQKATEECREEFQLVGREMESDGLDDLINEDGNSVVSVWGIAGVGKSSLVRKAYYQMIRNSSFESFGWVDVPDLFNLTQLCCRLLVDFYCDDPQAKETAAVGLMEGSLDPIQECFKCIHKEKCLVVIDGLYSTQDWDKIRDALLSEPTITGTTIVIITTAKKVAKHCVQNVQDKVLNIRRLEAGAAHDLLVRKIASDYQPLTSEEMEITKSIVTKCGGLPKVMTAVGEACNLHLRRQSMTVFSYKYCMWPPGGTFISDLETKSEFHGLRPLFSWMQSYFDACSDSIKPCIFYLSIFPPAEKKNIRWQRLLWRWIAEDYCRSTSDGRTCEENGSEYISELVDLSIIIQQSPRNKVFCEINGFFHEYIISRPMEDNLVFALEKGCSLNPTRAGQHLTIRRGWDRKDKIVFESIDFSRLRSLTVFGKWELFFISSKNIDMRLLRVLDLEDATDVTNEDLEQIAKLLRRLKFLSVRGHTKITCLPSSIGGLRQLQTLDIRHTSIVTLPPVITKLLQKLRYMRAGTSTTEVWDWNEGDLPTEGGTDSTATTAECSRPRTLVSSLWSKLCRRGRGGLDNNINNEPVAAGVTVPVEEAGSSVSCNNRPRTLASSLLCRGGGVDNGGVMVVPAAGVTVPADIGNLAFMHTLGVVKVSAQCSKDSRAIFEELKKLTQLRKLGVSGINRVNIKELCSAISVLSHLKSLSVEVDKDDDRLDALGEKDIPEPPKSIESLKLYGRVHKLLLAWMKHLNHLERLKLDVTIGKPEEFRFQEPPQLSRRRLGLLQVCHLRIRPIQDGKLRIGPRWLFFAPHVVEVQCSSDLRLKFDPNQPIMVLKVHFSSSRGSISEISGLSNWPLKEVWLKVHSDAQRQYMQQQMQQQIDGMRLFPGQNRPVLKLVETRSS